MSRALSDAAFHRLTARLRLNTDGLIPVIVQEQGSRDVLMHAWMNEEALRRTLETGQMHYWSRSRQSLWLKGETSGNYQQLQSITLDCDGDTLLAEITQHGVACHTGRRSCFFYAIDAQGNIREG